MIIEKHGIKGYILTFFTRVYFNLVHGAFHLRNSHCVLTVPSAIKLALFEFKFIRFDFTGSIFSLQIDILFNAICFN